jgi:ATP-binding cassette, subfamily B, bacterial
MKNKLLSFTKSFRFIVRLTFQVDKRLFLLNTFIYLLLAVLPLFSLWILKLLVDRIIETKELFHPDVYGFVALFITIQLLHSLVQQWSAYYLQKQQYLLSEHITLKVLSKAGEIDYSYYEDPVFYDSLHLAQNQSAYLPSHIINTLQTLLQQLITISALVIFLLSVHWSIPFFLILSSLPLAISKLFYGQRQFQMEKSIIPEQRKAADLFSYVTTNNYAKELRVFNFGQFFTNRYRQMQRSIYEKRNRLHYIYMQKGMLVSFFEVLFVTLFYLVLIARSIAGTISIGGLIMYFQAFQRLQVSVQAFYKSGITLFQHQLYLQEIMKYLTLPLPRTDKSLSAVPENFQVDEILIKNVSFAYPETERNVLQDINMQFSKGKFVAIVGENGSGKSTLLKLLCGLYKTQKGVLSYGGVNANELPASFFSDKISVVFQDFGKYHLTVEDNIAIGKNDPDPDKINFALNRATGQKILKSLQSGLKSSLGRNYALGEELSGGQWQKIAIARALYKDHQVLILDEPTSAIDPLAEIEFFTNLRSDIGDKIIILITHRLYNLKLADYIYVMDDSLVKESGTFEELISNKGYFYQYYNAQKI